MFTPDMLDQLAVTLAARCAVRFSVGRPGGAECELDVARRLRQNAVVERQWGDGDDDRDEFDLGAVHVVGWRDDEAVCCGRIVLPPGPLPTEVACQLVIEPAGQVVDVGRMVVVPSARGQGSGVFTALLAALYVETRRLGFSTGCGMMAPNVRALVRVLGVPIDVLGPDRSYRGESRAPVRFDVAAHGGELVARWA